MEAVARKPDGGEPAGAELVHDPVASVVIDVTEVDGVEAAEPIPLDLFGVADALGKEKAKVIVWLGGCGGRHVEYRIRVASQRRGRLVTRLDHGDLDDITA